MAWVPLVSAGWVRVESPNFQVYTTAGEARGSELASFFEELRANFARVFPETRIQKRVRIIAFANHEEYKPYRVGNFAAAYYIRRDDQNVIVLDSADQNVLTISAHEFTHLVIEQAGWHFPAWLNEGMAEYYSSLSRSGGKLVIGRPIDSRLQIVDVAPSVNLAQMFSLGPNAIEYTERDRPGLFYAQSWLFVHMLKSDPKYAPKFDQLLSAITGPKDSATVLTSVYGRTLRQIEDDLRSYSRRIKQETQVLSDATPDPLAQTVSGQPDELGGRMAAADLLSMLGRKTEADAALAEAQTLFPKAWQVTAERARSAFRSGDVASARMHYAAAIAAGGNDPQLLLEYAKLLKDSSGDTGERAGALKRALEVNPDFDEANLLLGLDMYRARNYLEAVRLLQRVQRAEGPQSYLVNRALADSYWRLGHLAEAVQAADKARSFAKDPDQIVALDRLRQQIASPPPPAASNSAADPVEEDPNYTPRPSVAPRKAPSASASGLILHRKEQLSTVEGMLVEFDCKAPSLKVKTAAGTVDLLVDDPALVSIQGSTTRKLEFTCGPQSPKPIRAEYLDQNGRKLIRWLEFK